jgi:hypothetical protein
MYAVWTRVGGGPVGPDEKRDDARGAVGTNTESQAAAVIAESGAPTIARGVHALTSRCKHLKIHI